MKIFSTCIVAVVMMAAQIWAAECGDAAGPGGTRVACQCGDTVTTSTKLQPTDPVVSTACQDGLDIRSNDITLNCADQTLQGTGAGIGIDFSDLTATTIVNCTIKNCTVRGFVYGILVQQCDNFRIAANTVIGNQVGIIYTGGASNEGGRVWKNRAVANSSKGISVWGTGNLIAKNRVSGSGFGLFVTGDFNIITGNKVSGSTSAGIQVSGTSSHNNQITNNYSTLSYAGIVVWDNMGGVVAHNRVSDNVGVGLYVLDSGGMEIRENTGKRNRWDGLLVRHTNFLDRSVVNILSGNEFNRNGRHGICSTLEHQDGGGNTGKKNTLKPDVTFDGGC